MEIKNLEKTAKRILSAIKKQERIILFGDADLDGITSAIILEEAMKNLGGSPSLYFPQRGIEGYGLNESALGLFQKSAPALIILVDCGIGNFQEIAKAKKIGLEVIVIDHHEILSELPPASIIVDPKQESDKYPFKKLATCGICFRLAKILLKKKMSQALEKSLLELAALGTLADMMPKIEDNQLLVQNGLSSLATTFRPGFQVILKSLEGKNYSFSEIPSKIISLLQITDLTDHLPESYLLLTAPNRAAAEKLFEVLWQKNLQRKELTRALVDEIGEKVKNSPPSAFVFEGGEDIPANLTGSLASRLHAKFKKPTFIYHSNRQISRGSVRTPEQVNGVEALKHCRGLLEVYGGHPQAAGFAVKNESLEKLKQCLEEYLKKS